jgi:hypothetical protein
MRCREATEVILEIMRIYDHRTVNPISQSPLGQLSESFEKGAVSDSRRLQAKQARLVTESGSS